MILLRLIISFFERTFIAKSFSVFFSRTRYTLPTSPLPRSLILWKLLGPISMLRTRIELDEYVRRNAVRGEPPGPIDGFGLGGERVDMDDEPAMAVLLLPLGPAPRKLGDDGSFGDDHDRAGEFWRDDDEGRREATGAPPFPEDDRFEPDDDFVVASEVDDLGVL